MAIPEHRYLAAFGTAGKQIEEAANSIIGSQFRWLKARPSRPAFADLIFAIGSKIYSVLIVECKNKKRLFGLNSEVSFSIPSAEQALIIDECKANNLIPVIFPLYLDAMQPLSMGWNLFSLPDMKACDPLKEGIDTSAIPMSKWEMSSFRVQIVMSEIEKEGYKILSYQDIPGIIPNIWFEDKNSQRCWVAVVDKDDYNTEVQENLKRTANRIPSQYQGYLAKVGVTSNAIVPTIPMRGEGIMVDYRGLEHVSY